MSFNTIGDVQDSLDNAFGWRRFEMQALISAMKSAEKQSPNSPLARALARSCAALIYAHWEGFVREACQCYVEYVAKRRLRYDELNDGLLRTALLTLSKRLTIGDEASQVALFEVVRRPEFARARIPKNAMVDTKSNLRYAVLCEILQSVGMSIDAFELKDKLIDRSLCDVRNTIAHGRELFPTPNEISVLHSEVVAMMQSIRDMIMAAARGQLYRTNVNVTPST